MYFVEKTKDHLFLKRFDYFIFIPTLLLCIIGLFVVRSAVLSRSDAGIKIITTQSIALIIGLVLCLILAKMDYKDLKTLAFVFYGLSIALLLVVLKFGSGDYLGNRNWIRIAGVSFQPSEILKITFIIIVSMYLERLMEDLKHYKQNLMGLIFFSIMPIFLVFLQKDIGTALIFISILATMLFIYGLKYKYFLILTSTFTLSTPLAWFFLLNETRKNRIRVFLDPTLEPLGAGLNVLRSKMTIGSGQLTGKGLFHGPQTQNSAVPVKESDFIFSVIGEELGFIGGFLVLFLIFFLIIRLMYVSTNARDPFGTFLLVGICAMIATQSIENIGMGIGLLPVTGITLPFISAGGSSLITSLIAIGIAIGVSVRRKKFIFSE
jgi:rod shape determining protein RodA